MVLDAFLRGMLSSETSSHVLANIMTIRAACGEQDWAVFYWTKYSSVSRTNRCMEGSVSCCVCMWIMMDKDRNIFWKVRSLLRIEQGNHVKYSLQRASQGFFLNSCTSEFIIFRSWFYQQILDQNFQNFYKLCVFQKNCRTLFCRLHVI